MQVFPSKNLKLSLLCKWWNRLKINFGKKCLMRRPIQAYVFIFVHQKLSKVWNSSKNFMFQDFVREMGIVKKAIISKRRHKSVWEEKEWNNFCIKLATSLLQFKTFAQHFFFVTFILFTSESDPIPWEISIYLTLI